MATKTTTRRTSATRSAGNSTAKQSAKPKVPSEAEVSGYFTKLSNWGRWGKEDQLGTLNLITPQKRLQAAKLVRDGVSVSCARPIPRGEVAPDITNPFLHFMTGTGEGFVGQKSEPGRMQGTGDFYGIAYHGYYFTHLDANCHILHDGQMYNGRSAGLITARDGAKAGAIGLVHMGVVTRGVLLDIPRVRGVKWLEPGKDHHIYPEDLDAAEKAQKVRVEPGDALLIRTGHWRRRTEQGAWPLAQGRAGLHAACLPWLHERGVAMLGSDGANDSVPSGYAGVTMPIHQVGIPMMGLWLMDDGNFEELAAGCETRSRWEFMFVLAPLRVETGTGSPANPLAIF